MKLNSLEKCILLVVSALAIAICTGEAEIGDTYQKTCAKYGDPNHRHGDTFIWYINRDFSIEATFEDPNHTCDYIEYFSWKEQFTQKQIDNLIGRNVMIDDAYSEFPDKSGGRVWESMKYHVGATLGVFQNGGGQRNPFTLSVFSQACLARWEASVQGKSVDQPVDQPTY
jgi:hypothetical protein